LAGDFLYVFTIIN